MRYARALIRSLKDESLGERAVTAAGVELELRRASSKTRPEMARERAANHVFELVPRARRVSPPSEAA